MQPSELLPALRWHLASHDSDGMFGASLDHSPSEQLDPSAWHTTVLILSRGMEHAELARAVASVANPLTGRLSKWSKSNKHYRKRFSEDFFRALNEHRVMVFAISAKGSSISESEEHFVRELGAADHYRRQFSGLRERVLIGPFFNARTHEESVLELAPSQATMAFFIAHFLRRIHQTMYHALNSISPVHGGMINWSFFADKPPGGAGGSYDRVLALLLGLQDVRGWLRWGYFMRGDEVETDLLADNLAGLLREAVATPNKYNIHIANHSGAGLFYWEVWTPGPCAASPVNLRK
jgi:hypothetical protein